MISIQDLGLQILQHNPLKFYIFGGPEYGIKLRYINELEKYYGKKVEADSVSAILDIMNTKHILPLEPAVYVVRYDESFISGLSQIIADKIKVCKIIGTIVCLYETQKHIDKCNKFLPDNTAIIDPVNPQFIKKYLSSDFPNLQERLIDIAINSSNDYNQAKLICKSLSLATKQVIEATPTPVIIQLIGYKDVSTENQFQAGIAAKNFKYLVNSLDRYESNIDNIFYCILQTMIELDKLMDNTKMESNLRKYVKLWSREDIYWMFNHTYDQLNKLRSYSSLDPKNSIIYLFGLLNFQKIPSLGAMQS